MSINLIFKIISIINDLFEIIYLNYYLIISGRFSIEG
jgi:hypothetical protein